MTEATKKYIISFPRPMTKKGRKKTFYQLAKKHIIKKTRNGPHDLSDRIDEIVYGV